MRYARIRTCDINNGSGLMVTLWTQGCSIRCSEKCHNRDLWDFSGGKEFTEKTIDEIIVLLNSPQNFAVLGGEPLEKVNLHMLTKLFREIKKTYPNKEIWLWTGREYEEVKDLELLKYVDYLVDGVFSENFKKSNLLWRGSQNQRIIDVKDSINSNSTIYSKYN